jgi:hypothetical protein
MLTAKRELELLFVYVYLFYDAVSSFPEFLKVNLFLNCQLIEDHIKSR